MIKLIYSILISTTLCFGFSSPVFSSEYLFSISGRSDIEREITIAKLLPFYQYMGGEVEIQWANAELTPVITTIEKSLIKEGIHQYDIVRNYRQSMKYPYQGRDAINLVLKTLTSRSNCLPYSSKATHKFIGQEGCSIEDNLDAMKIRK